MGEFDDLIPSATPAAKAAGVFDDLVPEKDADGGGTFDDLVPKSRRADIPQMSAAEPKPISTRIRESLSPLLGPTKEQILSEGIPDAQGNLRYRPMGGDIEEKGFFPALSQPLVAIPKAAPSKEDGTAMAVGKALYNTGAGFAEFVESPLGIATAGAGSLAAVPRTAIPATREAMEAVRLTRNLGRAAAGAFAADMAGKVPEAARAAGEASVDGNLQQKIEADLGLGLNVVLPGTLAAHAVGPMGRRPAAAKLAGVSEFGGEASSTTTSTSTGTFDDLVPGEKVMPEKPGTLAAQMQLLADGKRPAVLITPGETAPAVDAAQFDLTTTPAGVFVTRKGTVPAEAIHTAVKENRIGDVLGYGISAKPDPASAVGAVTVRQADGTEVQAVATDAANLPNVTAAARRVAGPGETVAIEPADGVVKGRVQTSGPDNVTGVAGGAVARVPAGQIATRPDLMQFKRMDDADTGVNAGDKLAGKWDDLKGGNLLLWEPADPAAHGLEPGQKYIVANGHHRFEFGERNQVAGYNAQVIREADGYSAQDARALAAEINIADGKGTIHDQVKFLRNESAAHGTDEAVARAGRIGIKGRQAATIAFQAGPDLYASFVNEQLKPDAAEAVAKAAPVDASKPDPANEALQRLGIRKGLEGAGPAELSNLIQAVRLESRNVPAEQFDLFAADDSAIKTAEELASVASRIQGELSREIRSTESAAKNAATARAKGLEFKTSPEEMLAENAKLKGERERWENWALHPELVQQVRDYAAMKRAGNGERVAELPAPAAPAPKTLEEKLDSLKIEVSGKMLLEGVTGLPVHLWNESINIIKAAVTAGKALAHAIEDGIAWLKQNHPEMGFDAKEYRQAVNEAYGLREFGQKLQADPNVSPEVKGQVGEYVYDKRSNETDAQAAQRFIDAHGIDGGIRLYLNEQVAMPGAVRSVLGKMLIKQLGMQEAIARGRGDTAGADALVSKQVDLIDHDLKRSTDVAQSLQAMRVYGDMSPEGILAHARRLIGDAGERVMREIRSATETLRQGFEKANEDALQGTTSDPAVNDAARAAVNEQIANSADTKKGVVVEITGAFAESPEVMRQARKALSGGQLNRILQKQGAPLGTRSKAELNQMLDDVAKRAGSIAAGHYQGSEPGKTLAVKLRERLGLSEEAALRLAKSLDATFADMVTKARANMLKRVATQRARQQAKVEDQATLEERIRQSRSVWNREKQAASDTLVAALKPKAGQEKTAMQELAGRMAARMRQQIEPLLPRKSAKPPLTDEQLLREAVSNADKYEQVWHQTKHDMYAKYGQDPSWQHTLDDFFQKAAPEAFAPKLVDSAIRAQLKAMNIKLGELVKQHGSEVDKAGRSIGDRVVSDAGLTGPHADALKVAFDKRFAELAGERKRKLVEQMFKDKVALPPKVKSAIGDLIKVSNLGAFDDARFYDAIRKKLDLPELTPDLAKEITRRANDIQKLPEGFQRDRASVQLLNFISKQKGLSLWRDTLPAIWYANILSGPTTHLRNSVDNLNSLIGTTLVSLVRNPAAAGEIGPALGRGFTKGRLDAAEVLRSGIVTGSRTVKLEGSRALELQPFQGAARFLNNWKYVGRALGAADVLAFKPLEELKQTLVARDVASKEGLRGPALQQRVADLLGNTEARVQAARAQAMAEGLTGLDLRRRVGEIIGQGRETAMPGITETAREFALRSTYNNTPYGVMGLLAEGINSFTHRLMEQHPRLGFVARTVVPFTNIVANVVNEKLNFTPVGLFRAWRAGVTNELYGRPITDATARGDLLAKAMLGTAFTGALTAVAAQYLNDEDPKFAITGNGPATPEQRKQLQATGWLPHAVKVGDHYVSYMNTPPALMLTVIGNYFDGLRYRHFDQAGALDRAAFVLKNSGDVITQQSFLDGIANLFQVMGNDNTKTGGQQLERWAARTASSLVVPNLVMQVDRMFDPTKYDDAGVRGLIQAQVPFVRRLNKPVLNVLGEPVDQGVLSRDYGRTRSDELWRVLAEKQAWIPVPSKDTIVGDKKRGPDHYRTLTPAEYYDYIQESGLRIRNRLEPRLDKIRSLDPEAAKKLVQQITSEQRERVLSTFAP